MIAISVCFSKVNIFDSSLVTDWVLLSPACPSRCPLPAYCGCFSAHHLPRNTSSTCVTLRCLSTTFACVITRSTDILPHAHLTLLSPPIISDLHDYSALARQKTSKMYKDRVLDATMQPWMAHSYGYEPG
jgi:hypothetical protein